jgi:DNA-binding NarL/FixJ family response regulator
MAGGPFLSGDTRAILSPLPPPSAGPDRPHPIHRPVYAPAPRSAAGPPAPTTPEEDTSILVVAEHALVRAGLRAVLGATPGLAVVAEAAALAGVPAAAARHRPDVVLLHEPPRDEAAVAALLGAVPGACVLYLGEAADCPAGAAPLPCVPRDAGVAELCTTIGTLLGGNCAACLLRARCPAPRVAVALSRRERQVAVRVAEGLTSKQIAAALGVSLRTVNTYRESLARKLGASSPAVLTRYVLEHGLHGELAAAGG